MGDDEMGDAAMADASTVSSPVAGMKRSSDEAGLDEPALTTPKQEHRSTEQDIPPGTSGGESAQARKPFRCSQPGRVMATARTISLAVTLPDDRGAALTELECEYTVVGANRATKETFKVDDPRAKQQVITLGVKHPLSLASSIKFVKVKAANKHGWSQFSQAAYDNEPLCCSPLDASLEELQAELQEAEPQGSRHEVLKQFLSNKRQVPQLKQLAADLQIEGLPPSAKKSDIIDFIVKKSSEGGSVNDAVLAAVTGKQQACEAARVKLQEKQQVLKSKQAAVNSEDASVRRAEADRDEAGKALAEAQKKAAAAEEVLREQQRKAGRAETDAKRASEDHEREGQKVAKAEAALNHVTLLQEALKQAKAAPQPPPATLAIVDKSSGLDSAVLAGGRPAPEKLTPLKLKNRIKKWADSDVISANSLQQCYKALGNRGMRDKATLLAELFDSCKGTVEFLRLPSAIPDKTIPDKKLTLISDKKLALIYTSNKDLPPPPADGKDRAAMVEELASWLCPRSSPTTAIVHAATLATPAEPTNQAAIMAVAAQMKAQFIPEPLHRQPSNLNRVKRATVRIGLFDTKTRTIFDAGSGVVIRGACGPFAQVLTCAHTFIGKKKPYQLFGDRPKESVVILVGVYLNDQQTSVWRYRAELLTPEALLFKEVAIGQNGRETLLDLAVLRVDRAIDTMPPEFQGMGKPSARPVYQLGPCYPPFDDQNSCPLRSDGLELGDAKAVATGSALSAAGWYSERAEKTIFVAPDFKILNKDDGLLKSNAVLDNGGSGGAQVDDSAKVVAINSMSMHVAVFNKDKPNEHEAEYATWGRAVDMLDRSPQGHGLKYP